MQEFPDSVALDAVNEITSLTNGLSRNIWQKIMLLDRMESSREARPETQTATAPSPPATASPAEGAAKS